jgi:Phage integrase family.
MWQRTINALHALPKTESEYVFVSTTGLPIATETVRKHFKAIVKRAKVDPKICFANLRDSAATITAQYHVDEKQYQYLLGHKPRNESDRDYIVSNPHFVADACRIIQEHYFNGASNPALKPL